MNSDQQRDFILQYLDKIYQQVLGYSNDNTKSPSIYIQDSITNSVSETNQIKASAGNIYGYTVYNPGSAMAWVKLFDKASAPTIGTDIPVLKFPILAGQSIALMGDNIIAGFAHGIYVAATLNIANSDNTAPASGIFVNITFK
jgi:hypothetical protein